MLSWMLVFLLRAITFSQFFVVDVVVAISFSQFFTVTFSQKRSFSQFFASLVLVSSFLHDVFVM